MSRFVLDCAVLRPASPQIGQWLATSAQRAWASPAAGYHEGKVSQSLLSESAATMARLFGAGSARFEPSPGSAVRSAVMDLAASEHFAAVATSAVDADVVRVAVRQCADALGVPHTTLSVDSEGRIDTPSLAAVDRPTILVTNLGNQEIGTLQTDLADWATATGAAVVLDARCALGWTDLPDYWDALIADPRAWGGPGGACAVLTRSSAEPRDVDTEPFDNVPAAVAAALSAEQWMSVAGAARESARAHLATIGRRLHHGLTGIETHGGGPSALPHVLSISVLYVDAEALQSALDKRGFGVGSGSACASRSGEPSHVLAAIGGLTSGNIRVGLPPGLSADTIERFADAVIDVVTEVREEMGTAWL
jgi:cysteine desulfurase